MDKKLLLTIQSVCNAEGVRIPWGQVGKIMGDKISDGAVIQHLAKLRQRMVNQGLSVPPPLRRGGTVMISTTHNNGSSLARAHHQSEASSGTMAQPIEDENEDFDVDGASDMEEDYGQARVKRLRRGQLDVDTFKRSRKSKSRAAVKTQGSDDDEDMDVDQEDAQESGGNKRKRDQSGKEKAPNPKEPKGFSSGSRGRRSSVDYAELNGGYDSNDDYDSGEGEEYVGVGAPYMKFAESDEYDGKVPQQQASLPKPATPSKIVVLQVGKGLQTPQSLSVKTSSPSTLKAIKSAPDSESGEQSEVETDLGQSRTLNQPDPSPNDLFGAVYADQNVDVYYGSGTTSPSMRGMVHTANGAPLGDPSYGSTALHNTDWLRAPQYPHSSFGIKSLPPTLTHVTIPPQASGPNFDTNPSSATTTYSDHTPVLMPDRYYEALHEVNNGMDNFAQAYHPPGSEDHMPGLDDGFEFIDYEYA